MEYLPGYEIHGVYSLWTFKVWCSKTCLCTLLYHAWSRQNWPWTLGLDPLHLPRPFLIMASKNACGNTGIPSSHFDKKQTIYYSGFPEETPEFKFRPRFFFVRSQIAAKSLSRMRYLLTLTHVLCATFWLMSTRHGLMADEEKLSRSKISTETVYNTLKTHTKYAHIVWGRPTLKDVERFRNGSVHEPYERSLYERALISEPFIEKQALSHKLRPWEKPYQHTWKNFFKIFFYF